MIIGNDEIQNNYNELRKENINLRKQIEIKDKEILELKNKITQNEKEIKLLKSQNDLFD